MTIRINIKSADFDTKSGTSKRGQAYSIREQIGYAQIGDEVRKVKISLGRDQPVYAVGLYVVDDASFTTDSYDGLTLGRLVLKLAVQAQPKSATG
jgi:Helix-destabilising protein